MKFVTTSCGPQRCKWLNYLDRTMIFHVFFSWVKRYQNILCTHNIFVIHMKRMRNLKSLSTNKYQSLLKFYFHLEYVDGILNRYIRSDMYDKYQLIPGFSKFFVKITSVGSGGRCVYSSLEPFKNLRITQWFTKVEGYTLGKVRQKSLIAW